MIKATDANGVNLINEYDQAKRVTKRCYTKPNFTTTATNCSQISTNDLSANTPEVEYFYDGFLGLNQPPGASPNYAKGKLTRVTSGISETRYTQFDNLGRLLESQQITDGQTYTSSYQYNLSGALVQETYPSGKVVRNFFESDGDLARIVKNGKVYASDFDYLAGGGIKSFKLGNGLYETAEFNNRKQLTQIGLGTTLTANDLWKVEFKYGEWENGNVNVNKNIGNIAKQIITLPTVSFTQTYKYDSLDRLTEAKETDPNGNQNWRQTFNYDRFGNRIGRSQTIGSQELEINSQTLPTVDSNTNRFSPGQGIVYDKVGNIIQDIDQITNQNRQFEFNGDNRQVYIKDANNQPVGTYYYDGQGKRVKKVTSTETTIFVYNALGKLVAEYSTQLSQTPTVSYLTTDQLGTPRVITNKQGEVISRRDFMPFGEELYAGIGGRTSDLKYGTTDDEIRQKFAGFQKDKETNLDFAEARYYSNQHGRFTTVDPLLASGKSRNPQTFNRYAYVGNNPIIRIDPNGTDWFKEIWRDTNGKVWIKSVWKDCGRECGRRWHESESLRIKSRDGRSMETYYSAGYSYVFKDDMNDVFIALDPYSNRQKVVGSIEEGNAAIGEFQKQAVINFLMGALQGASFLADIFNLGSVSDFDKESEAYKAGVRAGTAGSIVAAFTGIGLINVAEKMFGKAAIRALKLFDKACCFTAGTMIHTDKGLVPIEKIKVGDKVLSYNEKTKRSEYKTVAQTFTAVKDNIVKLKIAGEKKIFTTTTEHPFYVKINKQYRARSNLSADADDGEWKTADKLRVGDKVLRPDGKWTRILHIARDNKPTIVYNFEVEGNHNYFVGQVGVLSHNCNNIWKVVQQEGNLFEWAVKTSKGEVQVMADMIKEGKILRLNGFDVAGLEGGALGTKLDFVHFDI